MVYNRDEIGRFICNLRTPMPGGGEDIGSGIFIVKDNQIFVLTAAHVANKININTYIVLSDNNNKPLNVPLNTMLQGGRFENHNKADLSKARIFDNQFNHHLLEQRFFDYSQINLSDNAISRDIELTTAGFPLGLGSLGNKFSPLSYRTFAAAPSITLKRFDNQVENDFIILESPSIGGYSGGPVFDLGYMQNSFMSATGSQTTLHGIVHGTISDPTGGKLAAITPTKYLKDWL